LPGFVEHLVEDEHLFGHKAIRKQIENLVDEGQKIFAWFSHRVQLLQSFHQQGHDVSSLLFSALIGRRVPFLKREASSLVVVLRTLAWG
jgi:hypothetical protein